MPLNTLPPPAALPGASPPAGPADAPHGSLPLTGSAALLFGLLLAQTVGQAAPKTRTVAAQQNYPASSSGAAPAAQGPNIAAETPPALTVTGKGEDKKKDKDKTPAVALPAPVSIEPLPAPPADPGGQSAEMDDFRKSDGHRSGPRR